ncbi:uncharacterized protein LOC133727484 isoform X4 [Rosa rugosa]|uniref:uncharacterized protein LOC133727484 isoform X3 n=1 Tax=Rosa rugosa TaxID=74645 RepID=UPI002B40CD39|nr:uncharacterized protein LOC133727484 isoform X3 [Rosa rugosa]XP_062011048.1 uncharacterized protein LOC133727484 isoform X3 [Rosa rugosa]XP_062011049.1 uncharacterized protein LOC133727484 isoform X4 [Rosa rugosa]
MFTSSDQRLQIKSSRWTFIPSWTFSRRMAYTSLHGRIWEIRYFPVIDSWNPPLVDHGVIDQTRGLLYYVEKNCSKVVYTPERKYVCIAGRYLQGARLFGNSSGSVDSAIPIESLEPSSEVAVINDVSTSTLTTPTLRARFVGQGYKQVCGQADDIYIFKETLQ